MELPESETVHSRVRALTEREIRQISGGLAIIGSGFEGLHDSW